MGKDWLFGMSMESNVGWIKHRNCNGCPESCSQYWLYWDGNVNQWYLDTRIHVASVPSNYNNLFLLIVVRIIPLAGAIAVVLFSCFCYYDDETDSDGRSGGVEVVIGTEVLAEEVARAVVTEGEGVVEEDVVKCRK